MGEVAVLITIMGMSAVTLLIKVAPLTLLGSRKLPRLIEDSLKHLPVAVLAGMTVQLILVENGELNIRLDAVTTWAALPTVLAAIWTRNLFVTIAVGMGFVALVRLIGG